MDIVKRLEKWLEKDSIMARNWGEGGFSIHRDIGLAIKEIKRLRHLTSSPSRAAGAVGTCHRCHRNAKQCICEFPLRADPPPA